MITERQTNLILYLYLVEFEPSTSWIKGDTLQPEHVAWDTKASNCVDGNYL
ncbi:hypothetical protein HanXRQr2_Chr02g0085981 [Helianthus annuus]|uniref:Uncharacterized protein n=1 Tax=Helianthus annuus TaxID=4232 RepID=A0A9K3P145_HELAN|nr:hypothetical protein HanXRQr2_Chr02g0085981 [Helianthus annuus]KAJ0953376.1 hypothetical protein HanPSC8_Chr02g0083111 [Helianthus annuus]